MFHIKNKICSYPKDCWLRYWVGNSDTDKEEFWLRKYLSKWGICLESQRKWVAIQIRSSSSYRVDCSILGISLIVVKGNDCLNYKRKYCCKLRNINYSAANGQFVVISIDWNRILYLSYSHYKAEGFVTFEIRPLSELLF